MARFDAVSGQCAGGARNSERGFSVMPAGVGAEQSVRRQGLEVGLVQFCCIAQFDVGQSQVAVVAQVEGCGQIGVVDPCGDLRT